MRTSIRVACVVMLILTGVLGYVLASLVHQPEGSDKKVTLLYREYRLRQDRMERYAQESNPIVERKQLQVEDERRVLALQLELWRMGLDLPYTARAIPRP